MHSYYLSNPCLSWHLHMVSGLNASALEKQLLKTIKKNSIRNKNVNCLVLELMSVPE